MDMISKQTEDKLRQKSISNYLTAIKRTLVDKLDNDTFEVIEDRLEMIHFLIAEMVETEEAKEAREIIEELNNNYYRDLRL